MYPGPETDIPWQKKKKKLDCHLRNYLSCATEARASCHVEYPPYCRRRTWLLCYADERGLPLDGRMAIAPEL